MEFPPADKNGKNEIMANIEKPKHEEKAAPHKGILKTPKSKDSIATILIDINMFTSILVFTLPDILK